MTGLRAKGGGGDQETPGCLLTPLSSLKLKMKTILSVELWNHIHNIMFSPKPINGPNKLERYNTQGSNGLVGTNTLAYWTICKL